MIQKFESFITTKNFSDLKSWSAQYHTLKDSGYLPYEKTTDGFVLVPEEKFKSYGKYTFIKTEEVDKVNSMWKELQDMKKEYNDFLNKVSK